MASHILFITGFTVLQPNPRSFDENETKEQRSLNGVAAFGKVCWWIPAELLWAQLIWARLLLAAQG